MVSGLVTSPNDHCSIFSGDARLMRMASKSALRAVLLSVKLGLIIQTLKSSFALVVAHRRGPQRADFARWGGFSPPTQVQRPSLRRAAAAAVDAWSRSAPHRDTATATRGSAR